LYLQLPITSQIWWPLLRGVTTGDNWQSSRQKNLGGGSQTTTKKNKKLVEHTFPLGVDCMTASINLWELRPTAWIPCPVAKLSTSLNDIHIKHYNPEISSVINMKSYISRKLLLVLKMLTQLNISAYWCILT
jgi:hypothetical protein